MESKKVAKRLESRIVKKTKELDWNRKDRDKRRNEYKEEKKLSLVEKSEREIEPEEQSLPAW